MIYLYIGQDEISDITLKFESLDQAIAYVKEEGIDAFSLTTYPINYEESVFDLVPYTPIVKTGPIDIEQFKKKWGL